MTNLAKAHYVRTARRYSTLRIKWDDDVAIAESYYQRALKLEPNRPDAVKGLAVLYSRLGRPQEAEPFWRTLRQINPQDPDVQNVFKTLPR